MDKMLRCFVGCSVEPNKCIIWIATIFLETQTRADQTIAVDEFLDSWRNHLPENWRDFAKLELIQVCRNAFVCQPIFCMLTEAQDLCTQPTPATIGLKPELRLSAPPKIVEQAVADKVPTKARKWHEKFKKGKV